MRKRQVLMISYYWPPAGGPGVQRILKFAKYLPEFGWEPIILTVNSGEYQAHDNSLNKDIRSDQKVYKTAAFGLYSLFKLIAGKNEIATHQLSSSTEESLFSRLSRWVRLNLILPDGRIGWFPFAVRKGREIIAKNNIDLIFTSGPPHSVHLIGRKLAKQSSLPWVADFRDPWSERFYYEENKRSVLADNIELAMEKSVLNNSTAITAASPGFIDLLLAKCDNTEKGHVITNGYDQDDFIEITERADSQLTTILHIGNLSNSQLPLSLLKVLQEKKDHSPDKFLLKLIGSVHPNIQRSVTEYGLDDLVEYGPYLQHDLAVQEMQQADFLLTVVPDTANNTGIIPGKIFEYLKSGTAIILIGPPDCDAANIITAAGSGEVFDYNSTIELAEYISARLTYEAEGIEKYNRVALTDKLSKIFDDQL